MVTRSSITGLPPGFKLDEPVSELPSGFKLDEPASEVTEDFKLDGPSAKLPEGFQLDPIEPEEPEYFSNVLAGMVERATTLGGSFLDAIQTIGEGLEEAIPLGGFVWDDGDILPSYKSPEEFARIDAPAILSKGARVLKGIDLGYQEQTGWQDVKDAFSEGGAFSGSAYAEVMAYGFEQGVKSIPDMVAVITAFPAYIMARSGEIGEQRAQNRGKAKADTTDVLEAVPFAVASALLERIGAKGMTSGVKANLGKDIMEAGIRQATKRVVREGGRALVKEATTEAIQEGMIEYVGERYGTDVAMDFNEALDRAAGAAVVGGLFGGMVGGGVATVTEAARIAAEPKVAPEPTIEAALEPTPTVEAAPELETAQVEIGEATKVDDAVTAADRVINREIELHRQKEKARLAEAKVEVPPVIREAVEPIVERPAVTPEQIKAQELAKLDEERELAKYQAAEVTDITEAAYAQERVPSEEEIRLSEEARIESQAEIRRAEEARPAEASKDVQELEALIETAPAIAEVAEDIELDKVQEIAAVGAPEAQPSDASARLKAFQSTLAEGIKADQTGFETFMTDMKTKFDEASELLPEGTITNQKDFTQFVQAQTGKKTPLSEINLTRQINGKDGKVQVVQVKADVVLRQTRKKRNLAVKLLRCIYG